MGNKPEWYEKNRPLMIARAKEWGESHREERRAISNRHYRKHRDRHLARGAVARAIKRGTLVPLWCARCHKDDETIQAHHHSYALRDRFDVTWLCPSCHGWVHRQTRGRA